ncbi:MAG: 2-oxoacid:acceptor oxidoreductase family protein [Desulfatitalea sp.]|nr:2-oxoacid:acceptor oxidoreductase family protein [Desulfatitalea sp.]NNJ99932.1 2-oxoacid:acceptor oxidoreductase family protein [Desulfatitalea sp.]
MQSEVMFAGFGGQGILLSGKILAHAAMEEGLQVAWIPSYGPEMRGGTAYCLVVVSDQPIGSPIIKNPRHLVAMNRPSLEKFAHELKPGGVIISNASLISIDCGRDDVDEVRVPTGELATAAGSGKAANIVALAAFVARSKIVPLDTLARCIRHEFEKRPKLVPLNLKAMEAGIAAVQVKA